MWVPAGYVECVDPGCDAALMAMDRGHAHLVSDEAWLVNGDRTGLTARAGVASVGPRPRGRSDGFVH